MTITQAEPVLSDRFAHSKTVTTGLKCAPLIGAKTTINSANASTVETVLMRRATPESLESVVPMIPEPTTTHTRIAVPKNSAIARLSVCLNFFPVPWLSLQID